MRFLVVFIVAWMSWATTVQGQPIPVGGHQIEALRADTSIFSEGPLPAEWFRGKDLKGKDGPMAAIGRRLARLYAQHETVGASGIRKRYLKARHTFYSDLPVSADGEYITIDAVARARAERLHADLQALGLKNGAIVPEE